MSYLEGPIAVETPENVVFHHRMAGLSTRGIAILIDTLVQIVAIVILVFIGGILTFFVESLPGFLRVIGPGWLWAILSIFMWIVFTGYYVIFEFLWGGQTPGKRLIRIRVIKENGGPIGFYEALLRNLLRFVDAMPAIYGAGILSALVTSREQRLGDLVAGTVVVRESVLPFSDTARMRREVSDDGKEVERLLGLHRLGQGDFVLARDFLERRKQMAAGPRGELAVSLATAFAKKTGYAPPRPMPAEWFLEAILWQGADLAETEETPGTGEESIWDELVEEGEEDGRLRGEESQPGGQADAWESPVSE